MDARQHREEHEAGDFVDARHREDKHLSKEKRCSDDDKAGVRASERSTRGVGEQPSEQRCR